MKMKPILAVMATLGLAGVYLPAHASLATTDLNSGLTATDMVNSLLAGNSGITVSNIHYTGANSASGTFSGGSDIVGFGNGIVMTSGNAGFVVGPNNSTNTSIDNGASGDSTLSGILGGKSTYNASVLSFDFVPTSDFVKFSYVFGSEEYNEFVNSGFNDIFAFLVNGVNYALVPGTSDPVSINNVNCGYSSGTAYHYNEKNCQYFRDNVGASIDTQLDGLTTVLDLIAPVKAGVVNTMYLAIADVGDTSYDSAVFIKGGSFSICGGVGQPACYTEPSDVPEPGSLALAGLALAGLVGLRRRR